MGFGHIGYLETLDAMVTIPVDGPDVEDMLNILHGVDMAVDINIIIIGVDGVDKLGIVGHLYTTALVDGTGLLVLNPVVDGTVLDGKDVSGLASLCVDHGPYAASVAIDLAAIVSDGEITLCEEPHGILDPRLYIEPGILLRHLSDLDGQA